MSVLFSYSFAWLSVASVPSIHPSICPCCLLFYFLADMRCPKKIKAGSTAWRLAAAPCSLLFYFLVDMRCPKISKLAAKWSTETNIPERVRVKVVWQLRDDQIYGGIPEISGARSQPEDESKRWENLGKDCEKTNNVVYGTKRIQKSHFNALYGLSHSSHSSHFTHFSS